MAEPPRAPNRIEIVKGEDGQWRACVWDLVEYVHPVTGQKVGELMPPRAQSIAEIKKVLGAEMGGLVGSVAALTSEKAEALAAVDAAEKATAEVVAVANAQIGALEAERDAANVRATMLQDLLEPPEPAAEPAADAADPWITAEAPQAPADAPDG